MSKPRQRVIRLPTREPTSATPGRVDASALKAAVRDLLHLDHEQTVVIQELACAEPDCPPVETVIAVLSPSEPPRRWTLHQPLAAVTAEDIRTTLKKEGHP